MKRVLILVTVFLISTLACGLNPRLATTTPSQATTPLQATLPSEATSTQPIASSPTAQTSGTQAPEVVSTATSTQVERTKTPYPTSVLDNQMVQQIDQIQSQVVQERGLKPKGPVPVVLLSPDELRKNVTNDFLADYTDKKMTDDLLELSIVGLIKPNFDLRGFYIELLSEQVAGYYDNDIKEMFVVKGQGFEGPEHLTYSHEYTHVLQDQNYDIKNGLKYNNDTCDVDTERCAAIQALIEGDATQSEVIWLQNYSSTQDKQQIVKFYQSFKSPILDKAPEFMKSDFVFPYDQGLTFVKHFYDNGGYAAVDEVYKNPPVSTEQILHPDHYPSDTPKKVDLPDVKSALGDGWREVTRNNMGEWYTYLILAKADNPSARLDDATAQAAAAGWGGDTYLVLYNDAQKTTAFVMKTVWDTANDASEFASAMEKYGKARFGVSATKQGDTLVWSFNGGYSSLSLSGDTTVWIIAPDEATAQKISGSVQP